MTKKRIICIAFAGIILALSLYLICSNLKFTCEFFKQEEKHAPSEPIQTPPEENKDREEDDPQKKKELLNSPKNKLSFLELKHLKSIKVTFKTVLPFPVTLP